MIGTQEERQAIAESLAKMRGQAWAFASEELRNCEIDGAIRAKEMAAHMQGRPALPQPSVMLDASNTTGDLPKSGEPVGDPRDGLKAALDALAQAEMARDDAGEHTDRALQRVAAAEEALAEFRDLDARVDAWTIAEIHGDRVSDMPHSLIRASQERAVANDRLEHAHRAHRTLAGELRAAETRVQACRRNAAIQAQRVVLRRAEERAAELQNLMDDADELRADLEALAGCAFPNAGKLVQVTPAILAALNRPSRERGQHTAVVLEPHKRRWQSMHSELLSDPDAG
jgi:hypothetical protein